MILKYKNKIFNVKVLETSEDIKNGMMFKETLDGCYLFKLEKGFHNFWMKNCLINLDIIFLLDNKVTSIYLNCPPMDNKKIKTYNGYGNYVLEFPGNTMIDLKIGDIINLNN